MIIKKRPKVVKNNMSNEEIMTLLGVDEVAAENVRKLAEAFATHGPEKLGPPRSKR